MPHVCGDEPVEDATRAATVEVCPTYVGMNRRSWPVEIWSRCMPHVCGDEPSLDLVHLVYVVGMPHVCGDEPDLEELKKNAGSYAPRMWG